MKKSLFPLFSLLACAFSTLCFVSCEPKSDCNLNEVVIGEFRAEVPYLTYGNMPKLKRALKLAFLPTMRIDTIFLHAEKDDAKGLIVALTAAGQETDSIYSSVSFQMRASIGKPITWVPVNSRYCTGRCTQGGGVSNCITTPTSCHCAGSGNCSDLPIAPGGGDRPKDISEILISYLAKK